MSNHAVLNQHTPFVTIAGKLGTVYTGSANLFAQVTSPSVRGCSTFSLPAAQASLSQDQQKYSPLRMFENVALD